MSAPRIIQFGKFVLQRLLVVTGAVLLTFAFFLVLPLMQSISGAPEADLVVQSIDTADLTPPPPPPPEEEEEQEPEPEEQPPELVEETPPLDLSQLELALNPGLGGDWATGDFGVQLNAGAHGASENVDALFSLADLDQRPRAILQPGPLLNAKLRKKTPGTVYVLFIVDERGKVESPMVQNSSDPEFEAPALAAVKQWKFEPGKRNGQAVRFRMRVPITFPKAD